MPRRQEIRKKLAEAVSAGVKEIGGAAAVVKSADTVTKEDFISASGIIAGSPVYFGTMAADLKKVFDDFVGIRKKMENKVGAAFATAGNVSGGKETTMISIIQALLIYGMIIVGDPISATGHYWLEDIFRCGYTQVIILRDKAIRLYKKAGFEDSTSFCNFFEQPYQGWSFQMKKP